MGREPPKSIGRYEIERLLGQGGMGLVWLARDTVLGRRVAIKVLREDLALPPRVHDELVERMRHEARAAAAVSHPNIVTLHDMGEDEGVGLYLVFEYVPGRDGIGPEALRDRVRGGSLPLPEIAKLARELGAAMTFAHEAGVVHRDLKPDNVLFSRTGAKIADFGIARIPESTLTRANTVLGTPAYTAPEALGSGDFGPKSDQFALAATLYEAASGVRAFAGQDALSTVGKVTSEQPPPLEDALGSSSVVKDLAAALLKGLAKDPQERYASCAELGDAVARAIEGRSEVISVSLPNELLEVERTPLSSRMALAERVAKMSERPLLTPVLTPVGTERPSLMARKKTEHAQNLAAGIALLVIVGLVVFGRRPPLEDGEPSRPSGSASPTGSSHSSLTAPSAPPHHGAAAKPAPRQAPRPATPSSSGPSVEDAGGAAARDE